ncbi:hypothetical protein SAMN06297144_1399 [Sphingomonas guangdongensis]|uniref:Beta-barrel porin 2 n=1 Tax=Sphingomonas guangdongensis TaxID=1141890 RepID=A0A285QHZ9_9SPHN|nr:outer membrane beta-barrel protein [Sphingomonas guangdongensis]SOB81104.1 hypothetical protein SAMN06297144_1399 [Sphingomonas guangdongensis]
MLKGLLLAGIGMVAPHAAEAQDAVSSAALPTNVSIAQRARPDYDPIGGRIGSFFLYPRLDLTGYYTSNLRAQDNNDAISDVFLDVRPSARLASVWSRHSLQADVYYARTVHANYPREDFSQYGGNVTGRYDIGRSGFASLTANAARIAEPRTDINSNLASRSPITYLNLSASGQVSQDFARFGVSVSGGLNKQTFDNGTTFSGLPLSQEFRDNTNYNGQVEGRYRLGANTRLLARVGGGGIRYDINPFNGFDRDSNFYRVEGGVGLTFSELLSGSVTAGFYRQDNADPRFLDSSGLSFSADLLYSPTALTSVRLTADRTVEPGGSTITSGNVRGTGAVTVEHELRPDLILIGNARYSHVEPQGAIPGADEYGGSASALYYLSRRFRFNASVGYSARSSDFFPKFNAVIASAGVTVTL